MDINLIAQFIEPEILIIAVSCYSIGMFLKSSKMKDWLIPIVILIFGVISSIGYLAYVLGNGLSIKIIINGFIQGLLSAALAVYGNQVIKQTVEGKSTSQK